MRRDALLAGAAFLCLFGILSLANAGNAQLVERMGWKAEQNPLLDVFIQELRAGGRIWVILSFYLLAAVGAAVMEELLFRGMLHNVLGRYLGTVLSAVVTSLLFALIHHVWANVLSLFLLGMVLTWLYERTGRLVAPIAFHAINNVVALTFTIFSS